MSPKDCVTICPVVQDITWKKDGTNFVRLRVTFRRQSRYIKTNILVRRSQILKNDKFKDPEIRYKVEDLVRRTEKSISLLDAEALQNMSFDDVINFIQEDGEGFKLDFFTFAETVLAEKTGQSQKTYRTALNAFRKFVGKDRMDISEITSPLMRDWEKALKAKHGNGARAVSAYTACIAFIHGQARLKYNQEEQGLVRIRNPFQFYKPPRQRPSRHRALELSDIQKMIDMRRDLKGRERFGVDVFLISFALMGMNAPDLYSCTLIGEGTLHYYRTKTRTRRDDHAEMFVNIDDTVKELLADYQTEGQPEAFDFCKRYSTYLVFAENVNEGLRKYGERIGLQDRITLYWARHSWASIAYESGINKGLINDGLCHVDRDMKVTDIYIKKNWKVIWEANSTVLRRLHWN